MKIKRWVTIKTSFNGIHNWERCPIKSVNFLKYPHRHKFLVNLSIQVNDADREIEFFVFQKQINEIIKSLFEKQENGCLNLGSRSCEHVSDLIYNKISEIYGNANCRITISEDGENEATCEYVN